MRKIMACFDVGSDSIKLVVGETVKKRTNILAVLDAPCRGYDGGKVVNAKSLCESLYETKTKAEEMLGLSLRHAILSIAALDISYLNIAEQIDIEREDNLVLGNDVVKVVSRAIKANLGEGREYLSFMPIEFILDDDRVVKDPKGLTSKTLGVRGVITTTSKQDIYPFLACFEEVGISIVDISFGSVGDYYEFRNKELDNQVGAIINVGEKLSTVSIINRGIVTNSSTINLAGYNVSSDIDFVYKINVSEAKKIKENFALAHKSMAQSSNTISVKDSRGEVVINQLEVSEIVESRLSEILNLCRKEINCLTKKEISYIIVTGGSTEVRDFDVLAKEIFGDKYLETTMKEIGARNNKFSTCVGLIKYYAYIQQLKDRDYSIFTIDEQQELSGVNLETQDGSMIGKLFGYIFNG